MNYDSLIESLRQVHDTALDHAARTVNRSLVLRNWLVGAHLVEFEQQGEDRAVYGEKLLDRVAEDLAKSGLKGLGVSMLRMTRRLYELYPQIRQSAIAELPGLPGEGDFSRGPLKTSVRREPSHGRQGAKRRRKGAGSLTAERSETACLKGSPKGRTPVSAKERQSPAVQGAGSRRAVPGSFGTSRWLPAPTSSTARSRRFIKVPSIRQSPIAESGEPAAAASEGQPTPLPAAAVLAFSWTHLIEFIRLDDSWKRAFYENETLNAPIERDTATWLRVREEAGEYLAVRKSLQPQ